MGRLLMLSPDGTLEAIFDGREDSPVIAVGARHGHPDGARVIAVDRDRKVYTLEDDVTESRSEMTFPSRWFEVDWLTPVEPVLVIHDGDAVTRVPFVPHTEPAP